MKTNHGVWVTSNSVEMIAENALQWRKSHVWVFSPPGPHLSLLDSGYSVQENKRRGGKLATVSVWKRGTGHVNIIYLNNTAWVEGTAAFKDVTPAQLLDAISTLERMLGITIGGSPGGAGWDLLKKIHPEWIENIPVNLREMHFTPKAGPDLIWQVSDFSMQQGVFLHKFDKSSAYPAAATQTDIGVGTPVHLEGIDAWEAALHEKGHPQEVGVWRCSIKYNGSKYDPQFPPIWKEELGTFAGSEGWISGPIIRLLRSQEHEVIVHEGYVFPERHDLLAQWAKVLWEGRQQATNPIVAKAMKQIANSTIGFTAFHGFEEEEEEKRRPDIRLQVVSRNREIMWHNLDKVRQLQHETPVMVYMDAVYYLSNAQDGRAAFPVLVEREGKLGGFRYEGRIEMSPEVWGMFERRMSVADRLEYLNKIGWTMPEDKPYTCFECKKPLSFPETLFYDQLTYCFEHVPEYNKESQGW